MFCFLLLLLGLIFSQYGQSWREMRRFTLQALRDFGMGKASLEEKMLVEVDALTQFLRELKGEPVAFARPVQRLVGNVICAVIFGKR